MTKGKCEVCGKPTQAEDPFWTVRCPQHWQELERRKSTRTERDAPEDQR